MTNDELLALYLDNSLSSAQRQDFETRLQTSPEFVQEARELSALQNMLALPLPDDARTNAFLRSMEDNIAASVIAAGAATATSIATSAVAAKSGLGASAASSVAGTGTLGTGAATSLWSSLVASISSNVVGASIAAATILGGGATVTYLVVSKSALPEAIKQEAIAPAQTQATPTGGGNAQRQTTETTLESQTASNTAGTTLSDNNAGTSTAPKVASPTEARPTTEYSARISGGAAMNGRYAASIQDYTRQMQEKEAAGDSIGAALVEKSLGTLLRQAGDFSQSRTHLRNVLSAAQSLSMKELEGEATGELALIFLSEGNKTKAEEMLRNAVSMLTTAQSRSAARWQKELDKLTTK